MSCGEVDQGDPVDRELDRRGQRRRGMERPTDLLRTLAAVSLAVLVLLGATACGSDDDADVATTADTTVPQGDDDVVPGDPGDPVDPDTPVSSPPDGGDPDQPGDTEPPIDMTPVDVADAEVLVGLTLLEAEAEAEDRGWTVRVARLDGEDLALTEDYSPTRINVAVEDDVVAEVLFVG
jgi:hypothetical protein